MTRVLVIDDAQADRRLLRDALEADGFEVEEAEDGQEGLRKLFAGHPDAVVLDVLMPGMDGWAVCERIREFTETPIIMLTSLDREEEIVRGLELGADDFLSKPVSPRQLIARVKAVLRRSHSHTEESGDFRYDDGDLVVDTAQHKVLLGGQTVDLSPTEFRLLVALAEAPGRVHEYGALLASVWGDEYVDDIDFLRVYIWRLRKKLEDAPDHPKRIVTERGFGYRFVRAS
ncbi:MAG: DNA-binding response regulator [Chloroflexi bacterium]|nr:MAG: DNA-binding response regulator [Chloroflexota bacterium]